MTDKKNIYEAHKKNTQQDVKKETTRIDINEFHLPETTFVRDVDNKVFQGIILQTLSTIEDIGLLEGNFIDYMLGRSDGIKGLHTEQDSKNHALKVRIEINIAYGVSIPKKAEEIQTKVAEELTKLTGLHIAEVHVVFKALVPVDAASRQTETKETNSFNPTDLGEEYSDIF